MITYMISIETVTSFFFVSILLALSPGPDNIFVMSQSVAYGRKAGLCVVAGLCTGLIGHTAAVTLGIAAIVTNSPIIFTVIKTAGAMYLFYLGWQSLKSTEAYVLKGPLSSIKNNAASKLYLRGIIMNLSNPKVTLFFLAFLPQFTTHAHTSIAIQTVTLGALFILATLLVFSAIAIASGYIGELLQQSNRIHMIMHKITGLVFIALAISLLIRRL